MVESCGREGGGRGVNKRDDRDGERVCVCVREREREEDLGGRDEERAVVGPPERFGLLRGFRAWLMIGGLGFRV